MTIWWIALTLIFVISLALDLGVFHRHAHEVRMKEALIWSGIWIGMALLFAGALYLFMSPEKALLFLTGYIVEKALSVDNLFVFIIIFSYFAVPGKYQHKILFWGILGAIISRGIMIYLGVALIQRFHWLTWVLGVFLILTGIKSALQKGERLEPEKNPLVKFLRKTLPVTNYYDEGKFFVKEKGKLFVTPLFLALLVVEFTDIVFAVDSIPAILGITDDLFIVYSSNLFAILGLRALYFALASVMGLFRFLQFGISLVLVIVGIKMLSGSFFHVSEGLLLGATTLALVGSIVLSILIPEKDSAVAE